MRLFKILDGLKSCHGGNHTWKLGEWVKVAGELIPCKNGIHLCREQDLIHWLHSDIYEAEYEGEMIECNDKIVVRKARITKHLSNWNERTARLFACWCARQVAHLNDDHRVIVVIETAERYANGDATEKELAAARDAARDAAWAAAWAADWAAAWSADWDAARDAAWAAARAAAWAAARDADWDAAWAADWDATRAAQTKKLIDILDNGWS